MKGGSGHVVIVETNGKGHRFAYVHHAVVKIRRLGGTCALLTTPVARDSAEFATWCSDQVRAGDLSVSTLPDSEDRSAFLNEARVLAGDRGVIVIPDGDIWAPNVVAWLVRKDVLREMRQERQHTRLIFMRMKPAPGVLGFGRYLAKNLLVVAAMALRLPCSFAALGASNGLLARFRIVRIVRDVALNVPGADISIPFARAHFGINQDALVLGVLGGFDKRKNPTLVLEVAGRLAKERGDGVVVFAPGLADGEVDRLLEEPLDQVRVVRGDGYLSREEYSLALRVPDVVLALHSNDGSSGVVAECAVAGVPVVGSGSQTLEAQVLDLRAGLVVKPDAEEVCAAIGHLLEGGARLKAPDLGSVTELPSDVSTFMAGYGDDV